MYYAGVDIEVPKNHLIRSVGQTQPYREIGLIVSARLIGSKYPNKVIVDVGANIGDTAILIASQCRNELILVEPSDFFHKILLKNVKKINNKYTLYKCLIGNGEAICGDLVHVGSTAYFEASSSSKNNQSKRLEELTDVLPCLVKLDTDGFDFVIIKWNIEYFKKYNPAIYFESNIRNINDLTAANEACGLLKEIGYNFFSIWDDAGFHIICTSNLEVVYSLNRYLYKMWDTKTTNKSICNFDVLAVHEFDADIYVKLNEYFISY